VTQTVLVTGSSGFVGRPLVAALAGAGHEVIAASRNPGAAVVPDRVRVARLGDLAQAVDWASLLAGVTHVVHVAGVAHRGPAVSDAMYDRINHRAVAALAAAAAKAGVARLIFISSIGSQSGAAAEEVLNEAAEPGPTTAYGRSKLAAEVALRGSGVAHTILRPVLMYGPDAPGNMGALVRLAAAPWPLPFAALTGRRSLLAVDNLISAIEFALQSPAATNETYVIADTDALALPDIIRVLRTAIDRPPRLFAVPQPLLANGLRLIGREELWRRLGGSLVVSPAKLIAAGWRPVVATREGLTAMMRARAPTTRLPG
jgi:nucleoside-diphosphate-sugar epimerase